MERQRADGKVAEAEPRPPFPEQHQRSPGLESRLDPPPRYEAEHYRPAGKLRGKAALITGGDSGIGRAVAVMFAAGADAMLCPVDLEACDRLQCRGGDCQRADVACLVICTECGAVEERVVAGVCVACLPVFAAAQTVEER